MRHIGLDLDNTIIDYDGAFPEVGELLGLLPPGHGLKSKNEVKSYLLAHADGMQRWMRLQGQVYGLHIAAAVPYDGVLAFLRAVRQAGVKVSIVSHKTRYGHYDETRTSLWDAARSWLVHYDIFDPTGTGLDPADLYFEETRDGKVDRIRAVGCEMFIDDLPEVLNHPRFPSNVERLWFASGQAAADGAGLTPLRRWSEIATVVLGHVAGAKGGVD